MASHPPPPPPPPHGQAPRPPGSNSNNTSGSKTGTGGLPNGNYDIFIIPPHSSGSGFLYLPSMTPHRNSFLLGVASALLAVGLWTLIVPVLQKWFSTLLSSGGMGVVLLVMGVGVAGWAWGKTQMEENGTRGPGNGSGSQPRSGTENAYSPPPPPPPRYEQSSPPPRPGAASGWEKAREETRKREEERKRTEEIKRKREEAQKARDDAERAKKVQAEKEKWEQARAREKETRERDARERIARERAAREKAGGRKYEHPTARSFHGSDDGHRTPSPTKQRSPYKSSASSHVSGDSDEYAASHSTARTTPPPSHANGPYSTADPAKIQIRAVYLFSDSFPNKPIAELVARRGAVTDGLVLKITSEGLFIDDDVRGVPQREWDVKAWTLKLVEDGMATIQVNPFMASVVGSTVGQNGLVALHVLRATSRDADHKKYTFVIDEREAWKVAIGLQKLRKGSQVRSLGMSGLKEKEVRSLLTGLGWV